MVAILFLSLAVLLVIGVPISIALGVASLAAVLTSSDLPGMVVVQRMAIGTDSFPLMAIPFFVLAGGLMENGGISKRLVNFATALVGHITGGLALVSVLAAMFFAGISGSAAADTAAIGSLLIPAMIHKGFKPAFATSIQASAGSIGVIIPPSIPMVVYGITTGVSIGAMFLGGFIPGIMMGLSLMLVSRYYAKKYNYPKEEKLTLKQTWESFKGAILALMTAFIIVGGIIFGIFTATESAVVACIYSFIVGMFVYKELKLKDLPNILLGSAITTSVVMLCVATATAFAWILTSNRIPQLIAEVMLSVADSKVMILIFISVIMLIVGTFLDTTPAIVMLAPILAPVATAFGIHPVHLGVIIVVNLAIGMCTPPVGLCLFVGCGISGLTLSKVVKDMVPFLAVMIAVLMVITFVPETVLFVPRLFGVLK